MRAECQKWTRTTSASPSIAPDRSTRSISTGVAAAAILIADGGLDRSSDSAFCCTPAVPTATLLRAGNASAPAPDQIGNDVKDAHSMSCAMAAFVVRGLGAQLSIWPRACYPERALIITCQS